MQVKINDLTQFTKIIRSYSLFPINIWSIDLTEWDPNKFLSVLTHQERYHVNQFVSSQYQNNYIICRGLLRLFLSAYTGIPSNMIEFQHNKYGKPFINSPFHFNISHSGNRALIVISNCVQIGIDIQKYYKDFPYEHLAKKILSYNEYKEYESIAYSEIGRYLNDVWVRKEAVTKGGGTGLTSTLSEIELSMNKNEREKIIYWKDGYWFIKDIYCDWHYSAAIAIKGRDYPSRFYSLTSDI